MIGTVGTNLLWFAEVRRAELVNLTAWTMLTPVFGILLGWLLLSEAPTPSQWLGIALVLAALLLIQLRSPRHHAALPATPPRTLSFPGLDETLTRRQRNDNQSCRDWLV